MYRVALEFRLNQRSPWELFRAGEHVRMDARLNTAVADMAVRTEAMYN